jgi:soluble P-type ATPase
MIEVSIPGKGDFEIVHVVFDVNGTIARDGRIEARIKERLEALTKRVKVYLLTADTYGTVEEEMSGTGIAIRKIVAQAEAKQKEQFIQELGPQSTLAVGNGENDVLMLGASMLAICVIAEEGASCRAVERADIVVYGREAVFGLLENPKRITATLRE